MKRFKWLPKKGNLIEIYSLYIVVRDVISPFVSFTSSRKNQVRIILKRYKLGRPHTEGSRLKGAETMKYFGSSLLTDVRFYKRLNRIPNTEEQGCSYALQNHATLGACSRHRSKLLLQVSWLGVISIPI